MSLRKTGILIALLLAIMIAALPINAADSPYLRNEMPSYLVEFQETVARQAKNFPDSYVLSVNTEQKVIALTFDDGPDEEYTPLALDALRDKQAVATFYVVGNKVEQYPEITRRIVEEGHEIGNHSWSHLDMRKMPNQNIMEYELLPTSQIIQEVTGEYPLTLRPPYGAVRDDTIEFLSAEGWKVINWSIDSFDWDKKQNSAAEIIEKVERYKHQGAIVLMHSTIPETAVALPDLISNLREQGYRFITVSELLSLQD